MKLKRPRWWIIGTLATWVIVLALIFAAYWFGWAWTGFSPETSEPKQHAKTLWDWLQLLAAWLIPIVIAIFSLRYTRQQSQTENTIALDNQRESALQTYLDRISDLILKENLLQSKVGDELWNIAQARTITVLQALDSARIALLIRFLSQSGLFALNIGNNLEGIDLHQTNLSLVDLRKTKLRHAKLRHANLSLSTLSSIDMREADLSGANISGANLSHANLSGADLRGIDARFANLAGTLLMGAKLSHANLSSSDLSGTHLQDADLSDADLSDANISGASLSHADLSDANLKGADLSNVHLVNPTVTQEQLNTVKVKPVNIILGEKLFGNRDG